MTESPATPAESPATPAGRPVFPPGRYGRRREPRPRRRWVSALAAGLTVLASGGIAALLYQRYGPAEHRPTVVRYYDVRDTAITVDFTVHKPAAAEVTCHVRARGRDGAEVGQADVPVGRGAAVEVTYTLTTVARPVTVQVTRCDPVR